MASSSAISESSALWKTMATSGLCIRIMAAAAAPLISGRSKSITTTAALLRTAAVAASAEAGGGASEMPRRGDLYECPELPQFHKWPIMHLCSRRQRGICHILALVAVAARCRERLACALTAKKGEVSSS